MNCIIPFTKDIKFKTNIGEILSISLEHEYTLNESELLGNFIVSGSYKTHEVSVNKEHFEHVLPFSVSLTAPLDETTLDFSIEDFTYEVLDNSTLKVDIEYSVRGEELEDVREDIFEEIESEGESFEDILEESFKEVEENEERVEEQEEIIEEIHEEEQKEMIEIIPEVVDEPVARDITKEEKETIIESINNEDNTFVTYHTHILKENETIETVCTLYSTNKEMIEEYNDITNITIGDKVIIPEVNE